MKNVFLKMATRMNWRVLVTVIGVAACVMYLNGTTAMVEGLDVGTEALAARVNQGPYLVYQGSTLIESSIDRDIGLQLEEEVVSCWALGTSFLAQNVFVDDTYVLACDDPGNTLDLDLRNLSEDRIWVGLNLRQRILDLNLSATGGSPITLEYEAENVTLSIFKIYSGGVLSEDWAIVSPNVIANLSKDPSRGYAFLLVPFKSKRDLSYLESEGYHAVPTTGTVEFFEQGISEVKGNLWAIVVSSAIVITVLVFSLLGIEVKYRERDIKIISQVGARPALVMMIFIGQALFISGFGALLGISMGVIATSFISSWSSLFGYTSFITPQVTFNSVVIPIITALVFGVLGGLFPSYLAARVRRQKGVQ